MVSHGLQLNLAGLRPSRAGAMGKRASTAGGKASTPGSSKKPKADSELADVAATMAVFPWFEGIMDYVDSILNEHPSASQWLCNEYPDDDDAVARAQALEAAFPPEEVQYMDAWSPGRHRLQLWNLNFDVQAGNKGLVTQENFKNLVALILGQGFRTCPDLPGVEALVITKVNPIYWQDGVGPRSPLLRDGALHIGEIGFVKGWTRSLAAQTIADIIIKLDLVDVVRKDHPALHASLCTVHGIVGIYASEQKMIDANRGGAMPSVMPMCADRVRALLQTDHMTAVPTPLGRQKSLWRPPARGRSQTPSTTCTSCGAKCSWASPWMP